MKELVEYIAKQLVDKPEKVNVEEAIPNEHTIKIDLKVDKGDIGKVIGKHGNTVNAMRTLLTAVGAKGRHRVKLEIIE